MTRHAIDREEVMAYVDGELAGARLAEVEAHVTACEECRTQMDEIRTISARLSAWQVPDAPNDLAGVRKTVAASVISTAPAPSWWRSRGLLKVPRVAVAGGLAVLAAALVTPWLVTRRADPVLMGIAVEHQAAANSQLIPKDREGIGSDAARAIPPPPPAPPPPPPPRPLLEGQGQGGGGQLMQRSAENQLVQARDRMIVRTARMVLTSDRFDQIRAELERLVAVHQGRLTSLNTSGDPSSRRSLQATVGVPAARLDALLAGLRGLGRVQEESLGSDDVTESFRDLTLRISNARREEQRLVELLTRRTGDLADVLAVEREIARVRLDIERMEAEMRATEQRVDLATVTLTVQEQYRADLAIGPLPLNLRFKNALVDGFRHAAESLIGASLIVLQAAPMLLVWSLILVWPVRRIWRRVRAVVIQT